MLTVALALFLAGPAEAWTKEPDAYRGVQWGATVAEAEPILSERGKHTVVCTCQAEQGRSRQRSGSCSAKPESDASKVPITRTCLTLGPTNIAQLPVKELWSFADDKFGRVIWAFDSHGYELLRGVMLDKYGPPTSSAVEAFDTAGGASFENERLTWSGPTMTIEIARFGQKASEGVAEFKTKAYDAAADRDAAAKRKAARESF